VNLDDKDRLVWALGERVKELTALHGAARILQDHQKSPALILQEIVALLPPAWQYPEITCARIAFRDIEAATPAFVRTRWLQSAAFTTREGVGGLIEVIYREEKPASFEGPFLKEERALIQSLAQMLASYFERKAAEEKILIAYNSLEQQVKDRTAQLRRLASELALTEERERRTIASDLHDHIGQALALIKSRLREIQGNSVFSGMEKSFEEVLTLVDQTIQSTRTLTFEISPPVLYELGLEAGLSWLCRQFQRKNGFPAEMHSEGHAITVPDDVQITVFRSIQELLLNAAKHAKAALVSVFVKWQSVGVRIEIRDDGVGFDVDRMKGPSDKPAGFGLFSIRERMKGLGGSLEISSSPGCGSSFILTVPISAEAPSAGEGT